MSYPEPCQYSTRLITKLESLDIKKQLNFYLIHKAIYWAKKYHDGQFRKSGEPFYSHPLEVAYMVSEYKLTTNVIVTAILHDIVEDSDATAGMILDEFSWRIAEMVDRLTRDRPDGSKLSVEEILNNAYEKDDKEVLLVKVVDRLHNMQTIGSMGEKKQKQKALNTLESFLVYINFLDLGLIIEKTHINICLLTLGKKPINENIINNNYQLPSLV
ncbi:MAG: HD domain-containing protein [Rickettsiaceae bacterium]|jgi:guanosine-3',5'-bis(diphosphate) 3'-pyrophosphohydrolase|nr:HD domain-containing protein [Rickettsiaceae bacterium]